ncbi:MAG: hypothetical protein MUC38_11835 [Cyclobacteriaceae bacterium]|nr:hypothetical protein [Cyclobacteriaceae bacterium]
MALKKWFPVLIAIAWIVSGSITAKAQTREAFDLATFTAPAGWQRESNENTVSYVVSNNLTGGWCRFMVYRSMASAGSAAGDFNAEWEQLVTPYYPDATRPNPEFTDKDGWVSSAGVATFTFANQPAYLLLTSITGYGRRLSVLVLMNSQEYMARVEHFLASITLTKPATLPPAARQPASSGAVMTTGAPASGNNGITKATTKFNDGWVSTIEPDKVVVTKGNVSVYLYHPLNHDDQSRGAGRDFFWDNHLTRQFRIQSKQYRDHGEMIGAFQAPYIEGSAIDPKTGRPVFLGLYVSSSNGMMFPILAVAQDEAALRKTFPKAESQMDSDLSIMGYYNRFAVTWADMVGQWQGGGSSAMNYYNAYTGAYAGMAAVAMSDRFEFQKDGSYTSKHQGASGMVGSMSTYSQEYKGKATVSDWEVGLSNRWKGETDRFVAWFEAVPNGRVLHLRNAVSSGLRYDLVLEK